MKLSSTYIFIGIAVIVIGGMIAFRIWDDNRPGQYDEFAQCIGESGAKFYGAFWCPHCGEQKDLFGNSEKYLPYVECSLPDRQNQTQVCIDAEITSYPTWEFADGERVEGVIALPGLAEKTGCTL